VVRACCCRVWASIIMVCFPYDNQAEAHLTHPGLKCDGSFKTPQNAP
jgi:hypothetical protein